MTQYAEKYAARVLIPGLAEPLYYSYDETSGPVGLGSQVNVKIGRSARQGWVIGLDPLEKAVLELDAKRGVQAPEKTQLSLLGTQEQSAGSLKRIEQARQAFTPELLRLFEWMSSYYGARLADVIDNAVPRVSLGRPVCLAELSDEARTKLADEPEWLEDLRRRAPVQAEIISLLSAAPGATRIQDLAKISATAPRAAKLLAKRGIVQLSERDRDFEKQPPAQAEHPVSQLTDDQDAAVKRIYQSLEDNSFSPALLLGVTGSGKTEVYIRAIKKVLALGKSALVVVPEIALTPQLVDRFASRIEEPLAVLHSKVGATERWSAWAALIEGKLQVAVGARSAIFAPLQNLGLIIVDEEHESSYKQSDGLRYNARDVAVMRAKFSDCPVVLGSATPSFETLLNAKRGRYELLELPKRVSSRPMPEIEVVDLRTIKRADMPSENISPRLAEALKQTLDAKAQAVILYNRRGFSSYLQCDTCGEVVSCPDCSVAFTYHKRRNTLLCHYCDLRTEVPERCQFCCNPKTTKREDEHKDSDSFGLLHHRGGGTERVSEELQSLFPGINIARMDRDTVGAKDSYRRILESMRTGESDVLIGTQMIAKGHDLPGVTLVGVIDADVGLHLPDFRSSEKTFQLITQAAGRAGRGQEPGRVIVQTRQPNHPTIVATVTGRFKAFARFELDQRHGLNYPPWGRLLRIVISSPDLDESFRCAHETAAACRHYCEEYLNEETGYSILGPSTAPLEKLRGRFRWNILVKSNSQRFISRLAGSLNKWRATLPKDARVTVDVDPIDML